MVQKARAGGLSGQKWLNGIDTPSDKLEAASVLKYLNVCKSNHDKVEADPPLVERVGPIHMSMRRK